MEALDIMMQAYADNYRGSIGELIEQSMRPEIDVADTPEKAAVGLTQGPPRQMAFPGVNGQPFNTMGMDYPIDMAQYDNSGNLIDTTENIAPGLVDIQTHPRTDLVVETPSFKTGGYADKMSRYRKK